MPTVHPIKNCFVEYVKINSLPIQIAQLGFNSSIFKSFDPIYKNPKQGDTCVVFIPGEIGDIKLYMKFLLNLYKKLDHKTPIIGLSHNGHCDLSSTTELVYDFNSTEYQKNSKLENSSILFNQSSFRIHGQVQSKLIFLKKFVPKNVKIFFISHGVGCYMTLQLINSYPMLNFSIITMIGPTIENLHLCAIAVAFKKFTFYKYYIIDKLIIFYKLFALHYFNWLFNLFFLDRLLLYLYKKLFIIFFKEYNYVDSFLIPYLVLLLEDSISLIKDINFNLMHHLSSRIRMIYFANDPWNYAFFSTGNKRRFSLNTFVVSNCETLAIQTRSLIKKSQLRKKLKQNLMKEVDTLSRIKMDACHDFQINNFFSRLLSIHLSVEILNNKMNNSRRIEPNMQTTFESKEDDNNMKSISKMLMAKQEKIF